jgi:hypothetical protein
MRNLFGITNLDENLLSTLIPTTTFGGGSTVENPAETLFLWRSTATQRARGGTLAFFLSDDRLEPLWSRPERYSTEFRLQGVGAVVEPDFSLWTDDSLEEQLFNVKRKKIVSRQWQEAGLLVAPCLNWASEESFAFCFSGVPSHCSVAFVECRTASSSAEDKKAFLRGLHEAVRQISPQTLVIYGGVPNEWWIRRDLPAGATRFVFLESWTDSRAKVRKAQEREVRERNQLNLFGGGNKAWAEEEVQVA